MSRMPSNGLEPLSARQPHTPPASTPLPHTVAAKPHSPQCLIPRSHCHHPRPKRYSRLWGSSYSMHARSIPPCSTPSVSSVPCKLDPHKRYVQPLTVFSTMPLPTPTPTPSFTPAACNSGQTAMHHTFLRPTPVPAQLDFGTLAPRATTHPTMQPSTSSVQSFPQSPPPQQRPSMWHSSSMGSVQSHSAIPSMTWGTLRDPPR